eukprot:11218472-Lingulodinium_polyedra.AAC.1
MSDRHDGMSFFCGRVYPAWYREESICPRSSCSCVFDGDARGGQMWDWWKGAKLAWRGWSHESLFELGWTPPIKYVMAAVPSHLERRCPPGHSRRVKFPRGSNAPEAAYCPCFCLRQVGVNQQLAPMELDTLAPHEETETVFCLTRIAEATFSEVLHRQVDEVNPIEPPIIRFFEICGLATQLACDDRQFDARGDSILGPPKATGFLHGVHVFNPDN